MVKVLGLPRLGIYSSAMKNFFEQMGCKVVMPSKVSQDIIRPGVMNSADFICYPYKVTLGQAIWCLEHGATHLVTFNSQGLCRFKHYHELQQETLRNLGYKFKMYVLTMDKFIPQLVKITGASFFKVMKAGIEIPFQMEEIERRAYQVNHDSSIRVGIVGEFFTMIEPDINFDIVKKLQNMGVAVHVSITLSELIKKAFKLDYFEKREAKREAKELLTEEIGGHGFHSIYNTIWYAKLGFDGVIHLLPLSCMPESTVEVLVDQVAQKYGVALYRFPIDENNFEQGFMTRLETFVSMLKRKKK